MDLIKNVIICDIDGTIADCEHRRHFVENKDPKKKDWKSFGEAMGNDLPIFEMIEILHVFNKCGYHILFVTGREEENRKLTEQWLAWNEVPYTRLFMRLKKDTREDSIVKKEILEQILDLGYRPRIVFDDRNSVVKMWRDAGLFCCQVAEGDF